VLLGTMLGEEVVHIYRDIDETSDGDVIAAGADVAVVDVRGNEVVVRMIT